MEISRSNFAILLRLVSECVEKKTAYICKQYKIKIINKKRDCVYFSLYKSSNKLFDFNINYKTELFNISNYAHAESYELQEILIVCYDLEEGEEAIWSM